MADQKRGKLIVFEGIDGCGKGEQVKLAHSYLWDATKAVDFMTTREPTRAFAEIRERMASGKGIADDRQWYAEMFTADRAHHCIIMRKALDAGTHILTDRYFPSTLAYQQTQGLPFEDLLKMQIDARVLVPDLTIIYDCPSEIAFARRRHSGATDVFDKDLSFQRKLRKTYLKLPKQLHKTGLGGPIVVIDASPSIKKVFRETKKHLDKLILAA